MFNTVIMNKVFIITGKKGEGKTTFAARLASYLKKKHCIDLAGFYSKGYWNNNRRSHFEIVDLVNNKSTILCKKDYRENWIKIYGYYFNREAIKKGETIIAKSIEQNAELILIDEAGKIEMDQKVWHKSIEQILLKHKNNLILCVRNTFLKDIIKYYSIDNVSIFDIGKIKAETTAEQIIHQIRNK